MAEDSLEYHSPGDLKAVRDFVAARAAALGLNEQRVGMLTIAVSELATNTLQHTAGGGRVRLFARGHEVICDVVDQGPVQTFGTTMPDPVALRGRGIAIVERVCDAVEASVVADGSRTRLRMRL